MSANAEFLEGYDRVRAQDDKKAEAGPAKSRPALSVDPYNEYAELERQDTRGSSADDPEPYTPRERQPEATKPPSESRKLARVDFGDIRPQLTAGYVVKGLIKPATLVAINGASSSGKTFFGLDLILHVAAGLAWRGRPVHSGLVCFFALEGSRSAQNRIVAWCKKHGPGSSLPFCLCPGPINLRSTADVEAVIEFVKSAEAHHGDKCVLIVIDTLSRAMAGGKENAAEDMTALIAGADTIRNSTGAAVVLVHHLGKDESRGARGHSSLVGALDTEIEISRARDNRTATVTKQRDDVEGQRFGFRLEVVELGVDDEGDAVTSCIVIATDNPQGSRKLPSGKNQRRLLAAIQDRRRASKVDDISDGEMREIGTALFGEAARQRLPEVIAGLVKSGWIENAVGGYRLLPTP